MAHNGLEHSPQVEVLLAKSRKGKLTGEELETVRLDIERINALSRDRPVQMAAPTRVRRPDSESGVPVPMPK